jgi:hypothetical protein
VGAHFGRGGGKRRRGLRKLFVTKNL